MAIFSRAKQEAKYITVKELHEDKNYSIKWMCRELNISRTAYYKWCNHKVSKQEQDDIELAEHIREMHEIYHGVLGYRRMTSYLNRNLNSNYSKKHIHRIMKI